MKKLCNGSFSSLGIKTIENENYIPKRAWFVFKMERLNWHLVFENKYKLMVRANAHSLLASLGYNISYSSLCLDFN
jgi:hypothetical protein